MYQNQVGLRQQNQGGARGDDADAIREDAESEIVANDAEVEPMNLTNIVDIYRSELDTCLMRHDYANAAQFQRCIMMILDSLNGSIPMSRDLRISLFTSLGDTLEDMAEQVRPNAPAAAARYESYSEQLRAMAVSDPPGTGLLHNG